MKRGAKPSQQPQQPPQHPAESSTAGLLVEIHCQVLRDIRKHARSSIDVEICGVLIGSFQEGKTLVDASIPGEETRQGGSHVTFTQDTWTHIFQVKDSKFPDQRIVGWYHSHPGFGVFLSDHDTFIHRNFFSDPGQIAWVYDPQREEEGCFVWDQGEIKRLTSIGLRDEPGGVGGKEENKGERNLERKPVEHHADEAELSQPQTKSRRARIAYWVGLTLSHAFAILLGLVAGALLTPRIIVVPERLEPRPAISSPAPEPNRPLFPEEDRKR